MASWTGLIACLAVLTYSCVHCVHGNLGNLLGGFVPVQINDDLLANIRTALESDNLLRAQHVSRLEKQQFFQSARYKVYLEAQGNNGPDECVKVLCFDSTGCKLEDRTCERKIGRGRARPDRHPRHAGEFGTLQEVADFGVEKINGMSNSFFRLAAENIVDITTKYKDGEPSHYDFTLVLVTTGCRNAPKNAWMTLQECRLTADSQRQQCRLAVKAYTTSYGKLEYSLESQHCGQFSPVNNSTLKFVGGDGHDDCHVYIGVFLKFKRDFKRLYGSKEEEGNRFMTFCENMKRIKVLQRKERGSATYGINEFADISEEEFRKLYLTPRWDLTAPRPWMTPAAPANPGGDPVPDTFDWRDHGAVTPVKNQEQCGSCWAFSTTGNIEGQWAIASGKLLSLSEQELVDCDKLDQGCEGGLPSNAYESIMKLGGLETESDYSYKGADEKCSFNKQEVAVKINGAVNISSDENEMKAWLFKNGPISIGINAMAMQFYFGGISHPWSIFCNPKELDHGVLIVGYSVTKSGEPYWIIKNSWGPTWGEKGYYLVYRGAGVCGLNTMCTSALIK